MIIPGLYPFCPQCIEGKCGNCDEQALDMETDEIVDCQCPHDG